MGSPRGSLPSSPSAAEQGKVKPVKGTRPGTAQSGTRRAESQTKRKSPGAGCTTSFAVETPVDRGFFPFPFLLQTHFALLASGFRPFVILSSHPSLRDGRVQSPACCLRIAAFPPRQRSIPTCTRMSAPPADRRRRRRNGELPFWIWFGGRENVRMLTNFGKS